MTTNTADTQWDGQPLRHTDDSDRVPDNLVYTINWLLKKWDKANHSHKEDRWKDLEEFVWDWLEIALVADETLTEDALELKRWLWEL